MRKDETALEEKREEICRAFQECGMQEKQAAELMKEMERRCLIEFSAPVWKEPPLEYIEIKSGHTGHYHGSTYKMGNIMFHVKESMLDALGIGIDLGVSVMSFYQSGWNAVSVGTIILAAISVAKLRKVQIEEEAAFLIAALWEESVKERCSIKIADGLEIVNKKKLFFGKQRMESTEYNYYLDYLGVLGCIAINGGMIDLVERVNIKYGKMA